MSYTRITRSNRGLLSLPHQWRDSDVNAFVFALVAVEMDLSLLAELAPRCNYFGMEGGCFEGNELGEKLCDLYDDPSLIRCQGTRRLFLAAAKLEGGSATGSRVPPRQDQFVSDGGDAEMGRRTETTGRPERGVEDIVGRHERGVDSVAGGGDSQDLRGGMKPAPSSSDTPKKAKEDNDEESGGLKQDEQRDGAVGTELDLAAADGVSRFLRGSRKPAPGCSDGPKEAKEDNDEKREGLKKDGQRSGAVGRGQTGGMSGNGGNWWSLGRERKTPPSYWDVPKEEKKDDAEETKGPKKDGKQSGAVGTRAVRGMPGDKMKTQREKTKEEETIPESVPSNLPDSVLSANAASANASTRKSNGRARKSRPIKKKAVVKKEDEKMVPEDAKKPAARKTSGSMEDKKRTVSGALVETEKKKKKKTEDASKPVNRMSAAARLIASSRPCYESSDDDFPLPEAMAEACNTSASKEESVSEQTRELGAAEKTTEDEEEEERSKQVMGWFAGGDETKQRGDEDEAVGNEEEEDEEEEEPGPPPVSPMELRRYEWTTYPGPSTWMVVRFNGFACHTCGRHLQTDTIICNGGSKTWPKWNHWSCYWKTPFYKDYECDTDD